MIFNQPTVSTADDPVYTKDPLFPVKELSQKAEVDKDFRELLQASLKQAKKIAENELEKDLYNALDWPLNIHEYVEYLKKFVTWIPQQSDDPAWNKPGTHENEQHQQEVYDRLCHFYWLIDQKVGPNNSIIIENIPWFSEWLVRFARTWGNFLDTTESFNEEILDSFIKYTPQYRVEDSMVNGRPNNPSGWLTFNQFFARELNPGLRPIFSPDDNSIVTSPADCTYRNQYDIAPDSTIPDITIKKTHHYASIQSLLEGSQYKDAFANGTFVHYFLAPYSYHRFHAPVSGDVKECYQVHGKVYLEVYAKNGQFHAPDSAQGGYEFSQARGIITIDTSNSPYGDMGVIAIIPVGMCQVSSVNMTAVEGKELMKGDEFGYFLFGGSDIIVLFQENVIQDISQDQNYRHYGTPIARGNLKT